MAKRSGIGAFAEHCDFTGVTAEDREKWLLARREGVGGSDTAAIVGVSDYKSALELYVEKTTEAPPDEQQSEVADWGRLFEPLILKEFSRRTGRRVVRAGRLLRSKLAPHYLTTLDGIELTGIPKWAKGPGVAEVKTTGFGERYADDLPVEVQVQVQWELFVTGATWATVIWLPFPERRMQWLDVAPHPVFQERLARKVDAFWKAVQTRTPPDPDGSESSLRALRVLYPEQSETAIRLINGTAIADEYERNKAAIAMLERRQRLIKNMLAATIREARYAVLDDGRYWGTAFYKARENRCPHCSEVLSRVGQYRTYTLRDPRKEPLPAITEDRALPDALIGPDLSPELAVSLESDAAPANDSLGSISIGGGAE